MKLHDQRRRAFWMQGGCTGSGVTANANNATEEYVRLFRDHDEAEEREANEAHARLFGEHAHLVPRAQGNA